MRWERDDLKQYSEVVDLESHGESLSRFIAEDCLQDLQAFSVYEVHQ